MTVPALDARAIPAASRRDWISMHVFYAANADPMLVDCVTPLLRDLRSRGLTQRHFFIKYWQEGPHIRLRFLPADGVDPAEIKAEAEAAIGEFLQRRPALYELDPESNSEVYKEMYVSEYGEQRWDEEYGPDGVMPFQPNNSFQYIAYEPEYDRYGGPDGIEVAEWHFEKSS